MATNTTVGALLQAAFRFDYQPFQVIGGPSWLDSERFDVEGRGGTASASPADVDAMVRSLLVTRFKIAYVRETRDMPVYHLVARAEARAASQLRPASKPCDRSPIGVNAPLPDPNANSHRTTTWRPPMPAAMLAWRCSPGCRSSWACVSSRHAGRWTSW